MKKSPLLFLLAHAGGNAAQYAYLFSALQKHLELVPIDLPGHGERAGEMLLHTIPDMARDVTDRMQAVLANRPGRAHAVFGHSLGSLLGYLASAALAKAGKSPAHLFVSSGCVPGQHYVPAHFAGLSEDALWQASADHFGGISQETLNCRELQRYFVPLLQADLGAVMQYRPIEPAALEIPVTALYGANDTVEGADMEKWRRFTTGAFSCHRFDGGHFYLFQRAPALSDTILSGLATSDA